MSLVSVVIPSFNHAAYIEKAVDSVLRQSVADLELIVVDDGSTDRSLDYLHSIRDPRLRLVAQANAGAHAAINRGLDMARGDFLAILNSDDVFHPRRLEQCVAALRDGVDLISTWIEIIDEKGKVLGVKEGWRNMLPWPIDMPHDPPAEADAFALHLLASNFVSTTSNVVFTRRLYEAVGGMRNLRFAHDWDFLLRCARQFRCALLPEPLLQYRIHKKNTISSNRAWMLFEICWMFAVHLGEFSSQLFGRDGTQLAHGTRFLANVVNVQGNERVLRMLQQYFEAQRQAGVARPEELLLDDRSARELFIEHIVA